MMETESGPASAVTAPSQTAALSQEDEDSELKDLVTQTLQSAGILGKIKVSLYYMYVQVFHFSEKKSPGTHFFAMLKAGGTLKILMIIERFFSYHKMVYSCLIIELAVSPIQCRPL